jgi:hypothetical protein
MWLPLADLGGRLDLAFGLPCDQAPSKEAPPGQDPSIEVDLV